MEALPIINKKDGDKMKIINGTIVNEKCQFYSYGDIAPKEYGAFCRKECKSINCFKSPSTVECADCNELINEMIGDYSNE